MCVRDNSRRRINLKKGNGTENRFHGEQSTIAQQIVYPVYLFRCVIMARKSIILHVENYIGKGITGTISAATKISNSPVSQAGQHSTRFP